MDLGAKAKKTRFWSIFLKEFYKENHHRQNWKICWQITAQPWCSHSNTFTRSSCKRQWYYTCSHGAKQPWRSHYNAICRHWIAKHNRTTRNGVGNCSSKTGSRRQSEKKTILKHLKKIILQQKHERQIEKICWQIAVAALMQPLQLLFTRSSCKRQ